MGLKEQQLAAARLQALEARPEGNGSGSNLVIPRHTVSLRPKQAHGDSYIYIL